MKRAYCKGDDRILRRIDTGTVATIESAIQGRSLVRLLYGGMERIAEPHILGVCRGSMMVLTYQVDGGTASGGLPQWRLFSVDKISNCQVIEGSRFEARVETNDAFVFKTIYASADR